MNGFLLVVVQNCVVAFILTVFVYVLTRLMRNPPLAHVLWLLVLLKLVSPPLVSIGWLIKSVPGEVQINSQLITNLPRVPAEKAGGPQRSQSVWRQSGQSVASGGGEGRPADVRAKSALGSRTGTEEVDCQVAPSHVPKTVDAAGAMRVWARVAPIVAWCWGGSLAFLASLATVRIVRFEHALRGMLPASATVEQFSVETAGKLGLRRVPNVRLSEFAEVPLLWCVIRPTIVLPMNLTRKLDEWQITLVLAHELAHLRRRDHWLRGFELVVAIVYWWNPLVWFVRRRMHDAEELCCDAWVCWAFPEERNSYAEIVLKAAESVSVIRTVRILPASQFLRSLSLKERIQMILESQFHPRVSRRLMLLIVFAATLVLPTFVRFSTAEAPLNSTAETESATAPTIRSIAIDASGAIEMDNKVISGAESLAELLGEAKKQNSDVKVLLSSDSETPHRRVREVIKACQQAGISDLHISRRPAEPPRKSTDAPAFPHVVKFEQGATKFLDGDNINILEVRGTAETFKPGEIYWIKGTYSLTSHDRATLAAYVTAKNAADGRSRSYTAQTAHVAKGSGDFTLFLPMACEGWPHVSFYSLESGEGCGGNYFGTGESVLKRWWGGRQ